MSLHGQQIAMITADAVSALAIVGAFSGILPPLAALGALCWYVIQVWESDTIQALVKGHRHVARRRRARVRRGLPPKLGD